MMLRRAFTFCAVAWVAAGCSLVAGLGDIDYVEPVEASSPTDPVDASSVRLADASGPLADAALEDASVRPADASEDALDEDDDAEAPRDASADARVTLFGCDEDDFVAHDGRPVGAARDIVFPSAADAGDADAPSYAPRCMRIAPGQSVTFAGPFSAYPLVPRRGAGNPIRRTIFGVSATFTFPASGTYGFVSPGRPGMRGAIDVRP
jgi:plastocyanin